MSVTGNVFSQSALPKNVDLSKLKDLGISSSQLKKLQKLQNSKTLKSNDNIDQFEFDRSVKENNTQNTDDLRIELSKNYQKDISLNASDEDEFYKVNEKDNDAEINRLNILSDIKNKNDEIITDSKLKNESEKYFGYNVFSGNAELFQKSVDDFIDPNYLISPGDEIIIMLWGETEIK